MIKKPTQSDVARLAGVSRATVSFVVNKKDTQNVPVSQNTRQRVLASVEQLGYVINSRAQSLRSGDTKTIGVFLPIYENPFFWQILSGISAEAERFGYRLLVVDSTRTTKDGRQVIKELAEQRVDGLILLTERSSLPDTIVEQLNSSGCPVVEISASASSFDLIHQGYGEGTKALMKHLFELGHRRISFIYGVQDEVQGLDRLRAYEQAFEEAAFPFDETWILRCGFSIEEGYSAALELLQRAERPTALIAINDLQGMAAIRAAADLGLKVPEDVSVAGFDNIPFAALCVPRLTTVASEPESNGRDAVRLLLERLKNPDSKTRTITSRWQLLLRESTGSAPQPRGVCKDSLFRVKGGGDKMK